MVVPDVRRTMFGKVLVANRGEIAVRVIATLRAHGIGSVPVYSDAAAARHVREADVAIRIGPAPAAESYLHIGCILGAAGQAGRRPCTPGTDSSPRMPPAPAPAPARGWCSSAPRRRRSRRWATRSAPRPPWRRPACPWSREARSAWPCSSTAGPPRCCGPAPGRALTLALTALALNRALAAYAGSVHWARASPYDWITTAALSFAGADIILHAGIGLRWPFTPKTTHDP